MRPPPPPYRKYKVVHGCHMVVKYLHGCHKVVYTLAVMVKLDYKVVTSLQVYTNDSNKNTRFSSL